MGPIVAHNSKVDGFRVGTLNNNLINIRVILVGHFRHCFRYQIRVSLVTMVLVVSAVVSLRMVFSPDR